MASSCVAFIADVHVGNYKQGGGPMRAGVNLRCAMVLDALKRACTRAVEAGATDLFVLGDLFDTNNPSPQVVRATAEALAHGPGRLYLLPGNHDRVSEEVGDHAMAALGGTHRWLSHRTTYATVVEGLTIARTGVGNVALVPFLRGPAREWLPEQFARIPKELAGPKPLAVGFHLGVEDAETPKWLRGAHDSVHVDQALALMSDVGAAFAFTGNWHAHRAWKGKPGQGEVVQCGALHPTGWSNPGMDGYGSLILWDGAQWKREVISGARFATVKGLDELNDVLEAAEVRGCAAWVRVEVPVPAIQEARDEVALWDVGQWGHRVHVSGDRDLAKVGARAAAAGARAAGQDVQKAIEAYVRGLDLPDGVTPEQVLADVKEAMT